MGSHCIRGRHTSKTLYHKSKSNSTLICEYPRLFSLAIHRQVLFVALECVNAGNFVLFTVKADHMRHGNICPVADLKQHFFLVIGGCRFKYFLAGQVAKIRPYTVATGSRVVFVKPPLTHTVMYLRKVKQRQCRRLTWHCSEKQSKTA